MLPDGRVLLRESLLGAYQEIPFEYKDPVIGLREPYDPHARSASVKRVASAVGEGSISIQLVHRALAEL